MDGRARPGLPAQRGLSAASRALIDMLVAARDATATAPKKMPADAGD